MPALAPHRREAIAISALLVILVFAVFGQTLGHGFVNYDDNKYVYDNPIVSKGLSLPGIAWAFTHVYASNWHPLTTMVHMLDCQLYALRPAGHHLTNVLLHAASCVLLFLLLLDMTGATWRCAFVAALFAIHPLRVESVAWISELKDVLSGLFFVLTLWAYLRYTRRPESMGRYASVLLCFALGLMSKPMLVTVPFVLLLLDCWPLDRFRNASRIPALLKEKIPLFALSLLSCVATSFAQKGAIQPGEHFPLPIRLGNALAAYVVYLGKLLYPRHLAVLYPLVKEGPPAWQVAGASLLLAALTAGAYLLRRRQPCLLVGWLWYLGMLVPVIGILQVGSQAYADRYTYLPQIGLCIAVTWAVADWSLGWRYRHLLLGSIAAIYLSVLSIAAWHQTTYWRDNITLWTHTLECTRDNYIAHNNLGNALTMRRRPAEAIAQFQEALQIQPAYTLARYNLGVALAGQGRTGEAIPQFQQVLQARPDYLLARCYLGVALAEEGRPREAIAQFRAALQFQTDY
jgi:tetratricopeptide (TPR) repeat protein